MRQNRARQETEQPQRRRRLSASMAAQRSTAAAAAVASYSNSAVYAGGEPIGAKRAKRAKRAKQAKQAKQTMCYSEGGCVKATVCSSEGLAQNRQIQVAVGLLSHEQQIDVLSKMVAGVLLWRLRHSFRGSRTAFGFFMKLHVQTQ